MRNTSSMVKKMSLDNRWNFISNKLQVKQVLTQIKNEFARSGPQVSASSSVHAMHRGGSYSQPRGRSPERSSQSRESSGSKNCFNCGQSGHMQKDCPGTARGRSPGRSPRKMERSGSRSSAHSNSSHGSRGKGRRDYSKNEKSRGRSPRNSSRSPGGTRRRPNSPGRHGESSGPRRSPHRDERRNSSPHRGDRRTPSTHRGERGNPSPHRGDRQKLIQRLKSGRCMECGSSNHRVADCPHRRSYRRPPTPRGSSSRYSRDQKNVNFKVAGIAGDPPILGREGDVDHEVEQIVDLYLDSLPDEGEVFTEVYENPYEEEYDAEDASETEYE